MQLEQQLMEIVDKVIGDNAISDYDGAFYSTLPELFVDFITNKAGIKAFNKLEAKITEISKLILEFRDNIERNHNRTKYAEGK